MAPITYTVIISTVPWMKLITVIYSLELSIVAFGNRLRDCGIIQQTMHSARMSHTIFDIQSTSAAIAITMLQTKMNLVKYRSCAARRWNSAVIIAICLRE